MTRAEQLTFLILALIGFALQPNPQRRSDPSSKTPSKRPRGLVPSLLGLALLLSVGAVFLTTFFPFLKIPAWALLALDSPLLVSAPLALLTGVFLSLAISAASELRLTVYYTSVALVTFLAGFFSSDFSRILGRIQSLESQYLTISFVVPASTDSTTQIDFGGSEVPSEAFTGDTSFSTGMHSLHNLADAAQRDFNFLNTYDPDRNTPYGHDQADVNPDDFKNLTTLIECFNQYTNIYPNGMPIQEDLYNLSTPLVRSLKPRPSKEDLAFAEELLRPILLDGEAAELQSSDGRIDLVEQIDKIKGIDDNIGRLKDDIELKSRVLGFVRESFPGRSEQEIWADKRFWAGLHAVFKARLKEVGTVTASLDIILHELREASRAKRLESGEEGTRTCEEALPTADEVRNSWAGFKADPYRVIAAGYIIMASGYPEEGALIVKNFWNNRYARTDLGVSNIDQPKMKDLVVRVRILAALDIMLSHVQRTDAVVDVLRRLVRTYNALLTQLNRILSNDRNHDFVLDDVENWKNSCGFANFRRYLQGLLATENRLLYFLGREQPGVLKTDFDLREHVDRVAWTLYGFAGGGWTRKALNAGEWDIEICFGDKKEDFEDFEVFRRDALLAAAYGNLASGMALWENKPDKENLQRYLKAAKWALLDARQITRQRHSKLACAVTAQLEFYCKNNYEQQTLSDIERLLAVLPNA